MTYLECQQQLTSAQSLWYQESESKVSVTSQSEAVVEDHEIKIKSVCLL